MNQWTGVNVDFSDSDITGAYFMPPLHQTDAYKAGGRNSIKGVKVNDDRFAVNDGFSAEISVDMEYLSTAFRCDKADGSFAEFTQKTVSLRKQDRQVALAINIFDAASKL